MGNRKSDRHEQLADREEALVGAHLARRASEELLDRVKEVSQAVDHRIRRVIEDQTMIG